MRTMVLPAASCFIQHSVQCLRSLRIEPRIGFIKQDHGRIVQTARVRFRRVAEGRARTRGQVRRRVSQVDAVQKIEQAFFGIRNTVEAAEEFQVFERRKVAVHERVVGQKTDAAPRLFRLLADIESLDRRVFPWSDASARLPLSGRSFFRRRCSRKARRTLRAAPAG